MIDIVKSYLCHFFIYYKVKTLKRQPTIQAARLSIQVR